MNGSAEGKEGEDREDVEGRITRVFKAVMMRGGHSVERPRHCSSHAEPERVPLQLANARDLRSRG